MRDYWIAPCAITICSKCGSRYAEALMMKAIGEVGCSAFWKASPWVWPMRAQPIISFD
jgi:hypothetical protein